MKDADRRMKRPASWTFAALLQRGLMLTGFTVLVCATLGFSPAYLNAYSDVKQAVAIWALGLLGPAFVLILWHARNGRLPIPALTFAAGWATLIAGFAVGMAQVHNGFEGWKWLLFHAGVAICGLTAVVVAQRSMDFLQRLAWLTTLLLLAVGSYGLVQWLGIDPLQTMRLAGMRIELPVGYPGSTFGNANFAVQFTAPAILLALGILIPTLSAGGANAHPARMGLPAAAVAVGVIHLCVTQSRGGLLSLVAGLLLAALLMTGGGAVHTVGVRMRVSVLVLTLFLAAVAGAVVSGTAARLLRDDVRSAGSTAAYRLDIWEATWRMGLDAWPFGVGPGQFDIKLPRFASERVGRHGAGDYAAERVNRAHNEYLDFLVEGGVTASVAWLLIGGSVVAAVASDRHRRDPILATATAGFAAVAVNAVVDFPLHNAASAILLAILAGAVVAKRVLSSDTTSSIAAPSPGVAIVGLLTGLCLLVLVAMAMPARFLVSQHLGRLAVARQTAGRPAHAVEILRAAGSVAPDNREIQALMAVAARQARDTTTSLEAAAAWVTLEPWSTSAHNAHGASLAELGQTTAALESFRTAYEIAPTNHAARVNAATALYLNSRYCEAYELYRIAEGAVPRLVQGVMRNYADAAIECGVTTEALQLIARYVAANPGDGEMRKKYESARRGGR